MSPFLRRTLVRLGVLILGLWVATAAQAASCGATNQRPCKLWERVPSCDKGLVEDFAKGRCVRKSVPGRDCGRAGQRPCRATERIPSCNKGLAEDFAKGLCVAKAVPGRDCGRAEQRPCKVWERVPSCNANLKEDFQRNVCVAVNCGKRYDRPCLVTERVPSCDQGLVENFLQGRCVPSADAERHRIAGLKLQQLGAFIVGKVGFAQQVAADPSVRSRLNAQDKRSVAASVNPAAAGTQQMPDGQLLRTLTVGATAGGKLLFVGTSGGAGAAIDLAGRRPVYAYATGDYSVGPGLAAGGGIDVGFWVCQNNKIGGDSWGVEFGVDDLVAAYKGAASLSKGPSIGIGLWFDDRNVFQGFTISPGFGIGADFGGVVKASTAVEGDDTVGCDGRPIVAGAGTAPPASVATAFIQDIAVGAGTVRHARQAGQAPRPDLVRICLSNHTGRPKALVHAVNGIHPLQAAAHGGRSCANFIAAQRLGFDFVDQGQVRRHDAMNLAAYAGDLVEFDWQRD